MEKTEEKKALYALSAEMQRVMDRLVSKEEKRTDLFSMYKQMVERFAVEPLLNLAEPKISPHALSLIQMWGTDMQIFDSEFRLSVKGFHAEICRKYVQSIADNLQCQSDPVIQLGDFCQSWEKYLCFSEWLRKAMLFVDRAGTNVGGGSTSTGVTASSRKGNGREVEHSDFSIERLFVQSIRIFKEVVFGQMKAVLVKAAHDLILSEMESHGSVDAALLKSFVQAFIVAGSVGGSHAFDSAHKVFSFQNIQESGSTMYKEDFEAPFLEHARAFYANKTSEWMAALGSIEYLRKVKEHLELESLISHCLPADTVEKTRQLMNSILIVEHAKDIVENSDNGAAILVQERRLEDLKLMLQVLKRVDLADELCSIFKSHVAGKGIEVAANRDSSLPTARRRPGGRCLRRGSHHGGSAKALDEQTEYVEGCISLYNAFSDPDVEYQHFLLRPAFEEVLLQNVGEPAPPEMLVDHLHRILGATTRPAEEETSRLLSGIVGLFGCLHAKDYFKQLYLPKMAARLFKEDTSPVLEAEVVTLPKQRCGSSFTAQMEGMLSDFNAYRSALPTWELKWKEDPDRLIEEFDAKILKISNWPSFTVHQLALAPCFSDATDRFLVSYRQFFAHIVQACYLTEPTHSKRKLTWVHSASVAHIRATFQSGWWMLEMNTLQAVLLLLFNTHASLTIQEIADMTEMEVAVVKRIAHPMIFRAKLLVKSPAKKEIRPGDSLAVDERFRNPHRKIKLACPSLDTRNPQKAVETERVHAIDSAIVRIMKSRHKMAHVELVGEVLKQLQLFKPEVASIKRQICSLVEREYLARDDRDKNLYTYLA